MKIWLMLSTCIFKIQSKFRKFLYDGLYDASSSLQLRNQLCPKMALKKTTCFSSPNLTVTLHLKLILLLEGEFRCVDITGHCKRWIWWRKLSIGRQAMFQSKRLIEHCDVCQVSLESRQLINQPSFVYRLNNSPSDIFCIWMRDKICHYLYELTMVLNMTKITFFIFLDYPSWLGRTQCPPR